MKIKKSKLHAMIRESIREQLEMPVIDPGDPGMQDVEELFDYIREKIGKKNFTMAKKFVDSLKEKIREIELRSYALQAGNKE